MVVVLQGGQTVAEHGRAFFRIALHFLQDHGNFFEKTVGAVIVQEAVPGVAEKLRARFKEKEKLVDNL